ncbi:hypothetical protein BTI84_09320 [Lactobacillus delbrueckii subsp. bulgaricus]|nr:hypothetical protein [Lactobacillus delbrueckii subsp. bulgaricus]MBT9071947.1 hypothetical protein [Lactobacillus delbrueckii subsp. bulgaricus]
MVISTKKIERFGKDAQVHFRLTKADKDRLTRLAREQGITLSEMISRSIDEYVAEHSNQN